MCWKEKGRIMASVGHGKGRRKGEPNTTDVGAGARGVRTQPPGSLVDEERGPCSKKGTSMAFAYLEFCLKPVLKMIQIASVDCLGLFFLNEHFGYNFILEDNSFFIEV